MLWTKQISIIVLSLMLATQGCNNASQSSANTNAATSPSTTTPKASPSSQQAGDIISINAKEFHQLIEEQAEEIPVIDVRTPEEYQQGHLPHAVNINIYDERFKEKVLKTVGERPAVMVYCRSGRRSLKAAEVLKEMGYQKIYNLRGGILEWTESGLPVLE